MGHHEHDDKHECCGCGHDHSHDHDDELDIIELVDEDGESVEFSFIGSFDLNDQTYIALEPADTPDDAEEAEVVILRIETDEEGQDSYVGIDDEKELQTAFDHFLKLMEEMDADE